MTKEIDTCVVVAMGWKPRTVSEWPFGNGTFVVYDGPNGECMQPGTTYKFSEDIARTWQMEDWIEASGDTDRYAKALHDVVLDDWGFCAGKETTGYDYLRYLDGLFWRLAHATPGQRCRAFLKVNRRKE